MKLSRGPAWRPPPQGTGEGDTPGPRAPPRCCSGAVGGKALTVLSSLPLPRGVPGFRALAREEGARRRFWARWECGRCGARARPPSSRPEAGRDAEVRSPGGRGPKPREGPLHSEPSARGKWRRADRLAPLSVPRLHVRVCAWTRENAASRDRGRLPRAEEGLPRRRGPAGPRDCLLSSAATSKRHNSEPVSYPHSGPRARPGLARPPGLREALMALSPPLLQMPPPVKRAHPTQPGEPPGPGLPLPPLRRAGCRSPAEAAERGGQSTASQRLPLPPGGRTGWSWGWGEMGTVAGGGAKGPSSAAESSPGLGGALQQSPVRAQLGSRPTSPSPVWLRTPPPAFPFPPRVSTPCLSP